MTPRARFPEARAELEHARGLDPLSPVVQTSVGLPMYFAGLYDEAAAEYRRALEIDVNFGIGYFFLGQVYVQQQRFVEAIAAEVRPAS